jgi:hypothetical protein
MREARENINITGPCSARIRVRWRKHLTLNTERRQVGVAEYRFLNAENDNGRP